LELSWRERAVGWFTQNLGEVGGCARGCEGVIVGLRTLVGIVFNQVSDEFRFLVYLPIYAVLVDVLDILLLQRQKGGYPTRPLTQHPKHKEVSGTALTLASDSKLMRVPGLSPFLGIAVHRREEKMVEKPYVTGESGIEAVVGLEFKKEYLPFLAKSVGYIVPETLDPGIVHTPSRIDIELSKENDKELAYRPQMKEPRPLPFSSSI
jgi:hypothetical protein